MEKSSYGYSHTANTFKRYTGLSVKAYITERRLQAAMERLSADHRQVIRLARIEKLPFKEIASRMKRSPGAVKLLLVRALRELKRGFGDTESLHLPDRKLGSEGGSDVE